MLKLLDLLLWKEENGWGLAFGVTDLGLASWKDSILVIDDACFYNGDFDGKVAECAVIFKFSNE